VRHNIRVKLTRRAALAITAGALPLLGQKPSWDSLTKLRPSPAWWADAKLGIWAHWGPQCGPKQGDWYARNMYIQGSRQYNYHCAYYGHPSKVGYKDVIPLWTAKHWEPETLIHLYKKAGARHFVALGVHCDNFDCWNSRHHSWNAVNHGPRRDVVGIWRKAARDAGLRFGVTEHLAWSWSWFNVNKNSDKTGPFAGVPYDGNDPRYQDLYFPPHEGDKAQYTDNPPEIWKQDWLRRVLDLMDQHRPDLFYTDGGAFDDVGLEAIEHYYRMHPEGVYTLKNHGPHIGDYQEGAATLDVERGVVAGIRSDPFQTDTCIGQWFYWDGFRYKTVQEVVHLFVDIVSKNGNLLLNFPLMPDGTLDSREESILEDFTAWTAIHGEAIFGSRPWKVFGEGPNMVSGGAFNERTMKPFTAEDLRFTTRPGKVYVFCLGRPEKEVLVRSFAGEHVSNVRLLGSEERLTWSLDPAGLRILRPQSRPSRLTMTFEVT
jgi:alpha-L-fucosidase